MQESSKCVSETLVRHTAVGGEWTSVWASKLKVWFWPT